MNNILFNILGYDVYGIDMIELTLIFIALIQLIRNRIASVIIIILLFFESYAFTALNTSEFMLKHQYSDVGLILLFLTILVLSSRRVKVVDVSLTTLKRGVIVFFVFFLIASAIDLTVNNVAFSSVIKVFRNWLCLAMLWFVKYFKEHEVKKVLWAILYISVFTSLIFCVEYITGLEITGARRIDVGTTTRASIPWLHALLAYTLLLGNYYTRKGALRW